MAEIRFFTSKPALTACALLSTALLGSCSSVERTPMEQLMAVQTVTPLAKPGTEMTAYALPTPDGTPTASVAALAAQTASLKPGETAAVPVTVAATTGEPSLQMTPSPAVAATNARLPSAATAMISTKTGRTAPVPEGMMTMAAMESDFDSGEPMGLENLVAKRIIVPMPKPELIAAAYANAGRAEIIPASLSSVTERPTSRRPELDRLISFYAKLNGLPEALVHRVVKRESTYNPRAYNSGNYGLMQIRYNTAKGLGYEGPAEGLFDAETNLKYATRYLRGAWMVADNENDSAVRLYASGYYYHAKRKGLLETLGMK